MLNYVQFFQDGYTSLQLAVRYSTASVVEVLLNHKANVDEKDSVSVVLTVHMYTVSSGYYVCCMLLIILCLSICVCVCVCVTT